MEQEKKKSKLMIIIPIAIVVIAVVGIVAVVGNKKMSKDYMESKAQDMSLYELGQTAYNNEAKAQKYKGQIYKLSGYVYHIERDFAKISIGIGSMVFADVYLPQNELASLETNEKITFIGQITEVTNNVIVIKNAYYIGNEYQVTGKLNYKSKAMLDASKPNEMYYHYRLTVSKPNTEIYEPTIDIYITEQDNKLIDIEKDITVSGRIIDQRLYTNVTPKFETYKIIK